MNLNEGFTKIIKEYPNIRKYANIKNKEEKGLIDLEMEDKKTIYGEFLNDFKESIKEFVSEKADVPHEIKTSNLAQNADIVPYITITNPATPSVNKNFYISYLFKPNGRGVYLCLALEVKQFKEFKKAPFNKDDLNNIKEIATKFRNHVKTINDNDNESNLDFSKFSETCDLESNKNLARAYGAGNIYCKYYEFDKDENIFLPSESELENDLFDFLELYHYFSNYNDYFNELKDNGEPDGKPGDKTPSFSDDENNMWVVIAGENSMKIDAFKKNNFVAIGWDLNDLTGKTKKEIREEYEELYPYDSSSRTGNIVSQISGFVKNIKIGDYIISADSPNNEYYVGKCTSEYYFSDEKDDSGTSDKYEHCRDVEWSCTIIKRDFLSENARKKLAISKSVSKIKDDAVKEEILEFVKFKQFESKEKRNMVYFGAPGTGKSHNLNIEMKKLLKDYENNYERVTFHPDYTYANFAGTYKPVPKGDSEISYEYVPGPFMRILVKALQNPSEPFVLLIEEINRANVAAVFGDVFQLLDRDKDTNNSEFPINSSEDMKKYLKKELKCNQCYVKSLLGKDYDRLIIPQNMFIWATMNSADQGVFPMDTAFKRRWDFVYLGIDDGADDIKGLKFKLYGQEFLWDDLRTAINNKLLEYGINEDKLMGPFFAFKEYIWKGQIPEDEFKDVFKNKILMYLFEDAARSRRDDLFLGIGDYKNKTYSDICNNFADEKVGLKIFHEDIVKELFKEDSE